MQRKFTIASIDAVSEIDLLDRLLFQEAVKILNCCEAQAGAIARSKFALVCTMKELGQVDKAATALREVRELLKDTGQVVDVTADLCEEFLDRFVHYCHR